MICPTCDENIGARTKCSSSYCEGHLDGEWEGRQAAIRDEVTYALVAMERDAVAHARNVAGWTRTTTESKSLEWRAGYIGYSNGERRRLIRSTKFLAAARRWLQETA